MAMQCARLCHARLRQVRHSPHRCWRDSVGRVRLDVPLAVCGSHHRWSKHDDIYRKLQPVFADDGTFWMSAEDWKVRQRALHARACTPGSPLHSCGSLVARRASFTR